MKGSTYFAFGILLLMIVAIVLSLQMPDFKVRLLPLMLGIVISLFAIARIFQELRSKGAKESTDLGPKLMPIRPRILTATVGWLVSLLLMIVLLGFPLAMFLFVAAYVKMHGRGWAISITLALATASFIYIGFDVALDLTLYRGILYIPLYRYLP